MFTCPMIWNRQRLNEINGITKPYCRWDLLKIGCFCKPFMEGKPKIIALSLVRGRGIENFINCLSRNPCEKNGWQGSLHEDNKFATRVKNCNKSLKKPKIRTSKMSISHGKSGKEHFKAIATRRDPCLCANNAFKYKSLNPIKVLKVATIKFMNGSKYYLLIHV